MPKLAKSGIRGVIIRDIWKKRGEKIGARYEVQVRDPNTNRRVCRSFADGQIADARRWGQMTSARFTTGLDSATDADWRAVGDELVANLRSAHRSEPYVREHERLIQALADMGAGDMKSPMFPTLIRRFLDNGRTFADHRVEVLTVTAHTRNRWLQEIRSVVRHAINTRRLTFNPIAGIKRATVIRKNKEVFTADEMRTLLAPERESDPYFLRFALLAYTGCRIGEAMHLRWSDIRWEARVIEICHQPGFYRLKRGKERFLPLQEELGDILRPRAKIGGFILADPDERDCDGKRHGLRFKAYLRRCGVDPLGRTPHSTRHTWISMLLAADVNAIQVAAWAGHESLLTTQGYSRQQMMYRQAVTEWKRGSFSLRAVVQHEASSSARIATEVATA
jgi:integrase